MSANYGANEQPRACPHCNGTDTKVETTKQEPSAWVTIRYRKCLNPRCANNENIKTTEPMSQGEIDKFRKAQKAKAKRKNKRLNTTA